MNISTLSKTLFIGLSLFTTSLIAAPQTVHLWRHMATEIEITASLAAIERFNNSQNDWKVIADLIPEASYTQSIRAAAQADMLPCIIEVDQPMVPNFAWSGFINPLDGLIDEQVISSIDGTGRGTYQGHVYSLGPLDVSVALFTRKSVISNLGLRYPTIEQPWTKAEFMAVLDAIKATGRYKYPLDMQAHDMSEWISYAWAPLMKSWGADLIDRTDNITVEGVLNSTAAIQFGKWIQYLVKNDYIDVMSDSHNSFINGDIAVQLGGSWDLSAFYNAYGDDLAILPVPDFGHGAFIGGGGWHWAMTESCEHPQAAKSLISFLMTPEEQSANATVIGIFPITSDAAELTDSYSVNGKWRIVFDLSKRMAVLRPETPAYTEISTYYKKAISDIINGMPPALALDIAVENIKAAFERNKNYIKPSVNH